MDAPIKNHLVNPDCNEDEYKFDVNLRPIKLNDYVGQEKIKNN